MLEKMAQKYGASVGIAALIIAALLWGGEYVVAKDVLDVMPPNWSNVVRMFLTSLFAVIVWRKHFKEATLSDWKRGAICGCCFGLGSALQIMGLALTNAGINAFLASAYVILVPFMVWAVEKHRPKGKVFVSALIGLIGVSIMSVTGFSTGELSIGLGEVLTLLSAFGYGGAIVAVDKFTEKSSVEFITASQFVFTFLIALVAALLMEEPPQMELTAPVFLEFVYLIFLGTFLTQLLFTYGTKYASANQAGVIFPLESVSATLFGCLLLGEQLEIVQVIGGLMLIAAIIISNVSFQKKPGREL